jgi:hypothetical protein
MGGGHLHSLNRLFCQLYGVININSTALKESIQFPARAENEAFVGAKPSDENTIQVDSPSALVQAFVTRMPKVSPPTKVDPFHVP